MTRDSINRPRGRAALPSVAGKIARRGIRVIARSADIVGSLFGDLAMLLRIGPRAYGGFARTHRLSRRAPGATFANGVTTTLTSKRAVGWHKAHGKNLVVVLHGAPAIDPSAWLQTAYRTLHCRFLVSPEVAAVVGRTAQENYRVSGLDGQPGIDLVEIWEWMHRDHRRWDLVLLDARQPLPDPAAIIEMQHAADRYHRDREIGFVVPAFRTPRERSMGYDFDRRSQSVTTPSLPAVRDYSQGDIARYSLFGCAHGFYAASAAIDRVEVATRHLEGLTIDEQVSVLIRRGWASNIRTLCLSSTTLDVTAIPQPKLNNEIRDWSRSRTVRNVDGSVRVVFVLNATSVSGGIRVVFEVANGLAERGFDVEIWSLQETPTWFDLSVRVRTYWSYEDMLLSLRSVDAIKVATWWETAEIVWLASVSHGVPVYFVQEFETWFYPDDRVAQAAVVASYRHEFATTTQAAFQQQELAEVGIEAALVPIGYDSEVFRPLPATTRDADTVLALGRSFFQKNFAMTVRAWESMGDNRPRLLLFGTEPNIVRDPRVEYHERPRDAQVNELYNRATIFVQTSRHEGFCLPVLEAMAAGCPVITTDSDGNRDFCRDGVNCVIVAQDDDADLARRIQLLLGDPDERARLSAAGLETARRFAWPVVLDSVAAFYEGVARSASPTP